MKEYKKERQSKEEREWDRERESKIEREQIEVNVKREKEYKEQNEGK